MKWYISYFIYKHIYRKMDVFKRGGPKGEFFQLRNKLDGNDPGERTQAAKRVVSLMRSGENVGCLFSSMLRCVRTDDINLKRLTYLYLVTYSEQESEEAIMVVNTFIKDSEHLSPIVRALAVRTMSRIRLDTVAENMILPIKARLDDKDPFVRKTACLAVAKLYDTIPDSVENSGLLTKLKSCLNDSNPLVVSNTAAAIVEINSKRSDPIYSFNEDPSALVNAMTSCTDFCQINLLDILSNYEPPSTVEAANMIDRITPMLKHSNPAIVFSAFRCINIFMDFDDREPSILLPTILPPFISLVSTAEPQMQFCVLRVLTVLILKYPNILSRDSNVFFCKYNDPSYVKVEKLEILVNLCNKVNVSLIISELTEYSNSVDVSFVRKSISSIGKIAILIPEAANKCVDVLVQLVGGHIDYTIEECVVVLTDLLRVYPGRFEGCIGIMCSKIEKIKSARAKAALLWVLGEYCSLVEDIDTILDQFLDSFSDEPVEVQHQLLTAMVKVYIHKPDETKDQIQFLLDEGVKDSVAPDVRNRAMFYWRLLSADQALAINAVKFPKSTVIQYTSKFRDDVVSDLLINMGRVTGILHITSNEFGIMPRYLVDQEHELQYKKVYEEEVSIFIDFDHTYCYLLIHNNTDQPLTDVALALNANRFGFQFKEVPQINEQIYPNNSIELKIAYEFKPTDRVDASEFLEFALRTNLRVIYFQHFPDIRRMARKNFKIKRKDFLDQFEKAPSQEIVSIPTRIASYDELLNRNIYVVAERQNEICLALDISGNTYLIDIFNQSAIIRGNQLLIEFLSRTANYALCE